MVQDLLSGYIISMTCPSGSSHASIEKIGSFGASGFVFKDTVDVISIEDTEV